MTKTHGMAHIMSSSTVHTVTTWAQPYLYWDCVMSAHKIRQKTKLYLSIAVCLHAVVIYTHTVRESERFYSRWLYSGSAKLKIFFSRIHDSVRCARSAWSWPIYRDCVQFSCKIFLPFSLHIFFYSHFLSYTHTHTLSQFRSIEFILTRTQRQSRIQIHASTHIRK